MVEAYPGGLAHRSRELIGNSGIGDSRGQRFATAESPKPRRSTIVSCGEIGHGQVQRPCR
jgi:hypothetical protein